MNLTQYMQANLRVLLVGPPGVGKTARVMAAAKQSGRGVTVYRAGLADRVDIGGALVPDAVAGVTRELPLETMAKLRATETPHILFLDDLGQAPMDVQAACMRLFDTGSLPDNVLVWAATNRPEDRAGVSALCEPLRSRFELAFTIPTPGPQPQATNSVPIGTWADELGAWCAWALDSAGAAPEIVAWHRSTNGRTLYSWRPDGDPAARYADYRSWGSVIRAWGAGIRDAQSMSAMVGPSVAVEFCAFAAMVNKIPAPADIESDPDGAPVPSDDPAAMWLIATALGAYMDAGNAAPILQYLGRMPRVYCALAARDAYRRDGAALARTPAWSQWFIANQELFK